MIRHKTAALTTALWRALKRARSPVTVGKAAKTAGVSEPYAVKLMRAWTAAGHLEKMPGPGGCKPGVGATFTMRRNAPAEPPILTTSGETHAREGAMTPAEFARARRLLRLSLAQMATALGRTGQGPTRTRAMRRLENGDKPIDADTAASVRRLLVERDTGT